MHRKYLGLRKRLGDLEFCKIVLNYAFNLVDVD